MLLGWRGQRQQSGRLLSQQHLLVLQVLEVVVLLHLVLVLLHHKMVQVLAS